MKWATRPGVHVDRAGCVWLIRRFIDAAPFRHISREQFGIYQLLVGRYDPVRHRERHGGSLAGSCMIA